MIKVELNDADIKYALDKLEQATTDLTPALKLTGHKLVESTEQRFIDKRAPDGTPWLGNADSTIKGKGITRWSAGIRMETRAGARRCCNSKITPRSRTTC